MVKSYTTIQSTHTPEPPGWCVKPPAEGSTEGSSEERSEVLLNQNEGNTVLLVVVLVMGVALIFICFAMVAICYR
jgi:hypothetical protein